MGETEMLVRASELRNAAATATDPFLARTLLALAADFEQEARAGIAKARLPILEPVPA